MRYACRFVLPLASSVCHLRAMASFRRNSIRLNDKEARRVAEQFERQRAMPRIGKPLSGNEFLRWLVMRGLAALEQGA